MEPSILTSTKKTLGIAKEYTAFDEDVIMHINSTLSVLQQLGVGPANGFFIEDADAEWEELLGVENNALNMVQSWVFLKVRMLFDPPATSFHLDAMNHQIDEFTWRISTHREWNLDPTDPREEVIIDVDL